MALKKKAPPSGAPEWVLTYGDMMSLLLCFFILLAAFADYEEGGDSTNAMLAIASIQQALGIKSSGTSLSTAIEFNALVDQLKNAIRELQKEHHGDTAQEGINGRNVRLRKIRDGMEIVLGGMIVFEPFSAELTPEGRRALDQLGTVIKGHRNMIEIRGHAGDSPGPPDWTAKDAFHLSHQRAERVADALLAAGIDTRTIRLVAAGPNEPVPRDPTARNSRADARRVEIIVRESLLDDYRASSPAGPPPDPANKAMP